MAKQNASRLSKEIKITVAAISVLLGVFGYLLFQRLHGGPKKDGAPPSLAQLNGSGAPSDSPAAPDDVPAAPSARASAASDWGIADDRWSGEPADFDQDSDDHAAAQPSSSRRSAHEQPWDGAATSWEGDNAAYDDDPRWAADDSTANELSDIESPDDEPAELAFPTSPEQDDPFLARDFDRGASEGNEYESADHMADDAIVPFDTEYDLAHDEAVPHDSLDKSHDDSYDDHYAGEPLAPAGDVALSPQPRDDDFDRAAARTADAALADHRDRYDPGYGPAVAPAANRYNRDAGNDRYGTPTPADRYETADDAPQRDSAPPDRYREPAGLPQHHAKSYDRTDDRYLIQTADNYWTISKRLYGTGGYFKALYEHNKRAFPRPDQLRPGEEISAPSIAVLEQNYPHLCPRPLQTVREPATTTVSASGRSRRSGRTYVVREGDTLFDIARHELGKAGRWVEIYDLNRAALGDNVDLLRPGTELILPAPDRAEPITRRYDGPVRR